MPLKQELGTTLFIADNCRMATQLMATALRSSKYRIDVVGSGMTAEEVRNGLRQSHANVVLICVHLKDGQTAGFDLAREVRLSFPKTDIIMLLDKVDSNIVSEAFCAGAVGILSRDEPFDVLCKCVLAVSQGQVWASSQELRFALNTLAQTPHTCTLSDNSGDTSRVLTKREESLAGLIAEGLSNREISRQLNLSEHTVRNYLFRIFNKLGTSTRLELALYVISRREGNQAIQG